MNISPLLLICLLICHYLCDYTHLSTSWMLNAKRTGKPLYPIFTHAAVHASFMHIVVSFYSSYCNHLTNTQLFACLILQLSSHFVIDVLKGRMNTWVPVVASPANKSHWYIFGLDQLLHQLVIVDMCVIAK